EFSISLESLHDFNPIPVAQDEITTIRGGTKIIKHQAVCPFQAFAVHRLNSEHKEFPELDMDERARGSLIHNILELFWKKVQTSERLHELYESNSLDQQIRESVAQGLEVSKIDIYGQQSFFDLEKERLANLLWDWMEQERQRPEFKISKLETKTTLNLEGLQLNLFVDRIDESRNGELTIIDYKTGTNQNLKKWFGERIEEPQLPLYSLTLPADALAFAVINKRKSAYLGLSQENVIIPGVETKISKKCPDINHWDELKDYWKSRLDRTAEEFLEGILKVDPLHEKDTCKLCDQKTLCRKTELLSRFEGEDE
ncbi:MAG: PD-(D/E)XK nuclease family protein, partial [Nitrospinota bacterium]|nr:PD-(D/E)XK nuclease family protein [Nitrospinota bacterium]